ncbi:AtpZ/AtpI family protein [Paracoccus sulfuroxidans]|uniref:ATP synthase protein I n=1 Tax=Paracoccus sulfuroxidans TaxID=384678 RepID=A0A562NZE0_9RHOB|nr:AtpZ/AtpI family protein [Paracoccus sulfuroxidans]TWI37076.1 ATP synthase protein I [Paracoccus sulfuroxidans]
MADEPETEAARVRDAERLKSLEHRLAQKIDDGPKEVVMDKYHQANIAWRMVTELVAGLAIGFGIGFGLDTLFSTMPLFLVIFVLLGLVAGVKTMMRTANEIGKTPGRPGDDKGE